MSRDSGLTWTVVPGPETDDPQALDPEVAFTPDGTFYVAYAEGCTSDACLKPDASGSDSRARESAVGFLRGWSLYNPGEGRAPLLG